MSEREAVRQGEDTLLRLEPPAEAVAVAAAALPPAGLAQAADVQLVHRLRAGDADALGELYDRYAGAVLGLARSVLRDERLAEEAAHDVFLNLWQNPDAYDPARGPFAGWLFRVARNRAIDLYRRRREQPFTATTINDAGEPLDPATFLVDTEPDPADQAVTSVQREQVRLAMRALSADHQRLLELAYFRGLTQSEIAAHLERPLGTVKTQIRTAMRRLADLLTEGSTGNGGSHVSQVKSGEARARVGARPHGAEDPRGATERR